MIVVADTSGVIAASDRNARESAACQGVLREAGTVIISPLVLPTLREERGDRTGAETVAQPLQKRGIGAGAEPIVQRGVTDPGLELPVPALSAVAAQVMVFSSPCATRRQDRPGPPRDFGWRLIGS